MCVRVDRSIQIANTRAPSPSSGLPPTHAGRPRAVICLAPACARSSELAVAVCLQPDAAARRRHTHAQPCGCCC
jgi:hypothetical protein